MAGCRVSIAPIVVMAFGLLAGGCGGLPLYQAVQTSPHKDVVSIVVFLDERCPAEVYRRIALDESAKIAREEGLGRPPLYEVKVLFVQAGQVGQERTKLAQVNVIHSGAAAGTEVAHNSDPRLETTLY